jgi:oxidoreductase
MTSDRPTETKSAIIFGATGAVGKPLLAQLLSSTHHSNVHAFVRRPFKEASPFKEESRLQEHVIDFDKLIDVSEGSHSAHIVHTIKSIGASSVYITCELLA